MQNIKEINTVELKPSDFDRAADLLTEAFFDNPSHTYILQDIDSRAKLLKWALKANLKLNLTPPKNIGQSFALVEDKPPGKRQIEAMGFWYPPQRASLSWINKLKSGWFMIPWKLGKQNYQRLTEVVKAMNQIEANVLNGKQAWFLNNMAIAKKLRGAGVGTRVLGHQLESVVEPSGYDAMLMTQREINVKFYQRLGFEIADKSLIGTGNNAFTNWCMMRHF